jgi:hypothetical protein
MGSVLWIPVVLVICSLYLYILSTNMPELKDDVHKDTNKK